MADPIEITDADIWVGSTPPANAGPDDFWFDTSTTPLTGFDLKGETPTGPPPVVGVEEPGDAFISSSDGHMWIWDGTQWVDVGQWQGPPGPTGPQGQPGLKNVEVGGEPDGDWDSPVPGSTHRMRDVLYFRGRTISVQEDVTNDQTIIDVIDEIPAGGQAGQVLAKVSGTDYDLTWQDPQDVAAYEVGGEPDGDWDSPVPGGTAPLRNTLYFRGRTVSVADDPDNDQTIIDVIDEVPAGGTTGQVLAKSDDADYATTWVDLPAETLPAGGTTGQALTKASETDYDVKWSDAALPTVGYAYRRFVVTNEEQSLRISHDLSRFVAASIVQHSTGEQVSGSVILETEGSTVVSLEGAPLGTDHILLIGPLLSAAPNLGE